MVCGFDYDTSTCQTAPATITNVKPTAAIDKTGATIVNGQAAFLAKAGQPVPFSGRSVDPGSDDLTLQWDWGDGAPSPDVTILCAAAERGSVPEPVDPAAGHLGRALAHVRRCLPVHRWLRLTGRRRRHRNRLRLRCDQRQRDGSTRCGVWQTNYKLRPDCATGVGAHLLPPITGFMSKVFNEARDGSTIANVYHVLFFVNGNGGSATQQLDRQLMTAWLNFANGAFTLNTLVDTDGNGTPDTAFGTAPANAEAVRLNPASTATQLQADKDLLERINGN